MAHKCPLLAGVIMPKMNTLTLLTITALLLVAPIATGKMMYVDAAAGGVNDGPSRSNAITLDLIAQDLAGEFMRNRKSSVDITRLGAEWTGNPSSGWTELRQCVGAGSDGPQFSDSMSKEASFGYKRGDQTTTVIYDCSSSIPMVKLDNLGWWESLFCADYGSAYTSGGSDYLANREISMSAVGDVNVSYTIHTEVQRAPISPYIYGSNWGLSGDENLAARRSGGNRLTGYNWENNFSNAGNDWYHHSDRYLVRDLPGSQQLIPGIVQTRFHDSCLAANQLSVITLQMAGFVAADDYGTVDEADTAPSDRWKYAAYAKGSAFCDPPGSPDTSDNYVFMDELVNFLVDRYGNASTATGVKCYSLDNEPALWFSTHARIHPEKVGCVELVNKSMSLSDAVKSIDPHAQILGPVLYGFKAYLDLQDAPDWDSVRNGYNWFLDYYLDEMSRAEASYGRRLLDVLDLHWYPEARGGGANAEARMQAPRTLWDSDYIEDSWIGQWFSRYLPLLPNIIDSINTYYPGTKLSITEYSYGAADHISGGIAMSDVLGIFGKYGLYLSAYWHLGGDHDYVSAAYKIYRNYDGANSTFGDTKVYSQMSDKENSSIYASVFEGNDSELNLIVVNKNFDFSIDGTFNIISPQNFTFGRVWAFDESSSNITEIAPISAIAANSFSYTVPALTVCHIVLQAECPLAADLTGDCDVDWQDVDMFVQQWLDRSTPPLPRLYSGEPLCETIIPGDINGDCKVDFKDFTIVALDWLEDGNP